MTRRALVGILSWWATVGAVCAVVLLLAGCASRSESVNESITVQVREEMHNGKRVSLKTTTTTNATAQTAATTAPDGAAIADQAVAAALAAAKALPGIAPATAAIDWASILAGGGALATTATTGYLALKKRQQVAPAKGKA